MSDLNAFSLNIPGNTLACVVTATSKAFALAAPNKTIGQLRIYNGTNCPVLLEAGFASTVATSAKSYCLAPGLTDYVSVDYSANYFALQAVSAGGAAITGQVYLTRGVGF